MHFEGKIKIAILILFVLFSITAYSIEFELPKPISELNTSQDDFAPSWNKFDNRLYYNVISNGFSIFQTAKLNNEIFETPVFFKEAINKKNNNQSFICFPKSDEAVFSSYRLGSQRSYLNLFISKKEYGAWTPPYPIQSLICDGFCGHPATSPDGSVLAFSTNCNSEYPDTDIWFSTRNSDDTWSKPIKLVECCSPGNEITPNFLSSDTLVFSSDGMGGVGGYDLYFIVKTEGQWQTPKPLSSLNTEFNESDPTFSSDGQIIFSSDRNTSIGGYDLFVAKMKRNKETQINRLSNIELSVKAQSLSIRLAVTKGNICAGIFPFYVNDTFDKAYIYDSLALESVNIMKQRMVLKAGEKDFPQDFKNWEILPFLYYSIDGISSPILIPLARNYSFKPSKLDIKFDGAPLESIKSAEAFFSYNGRHEKIASGFALPSKFLFDLNDISSKISITDTAAILLEAKDFADNIYVESLKLTISKSSTDEMYLFKTNSSNYYAFIFPIISDTVISKKIYTEIYNELSKYKNVYKSINIVIMHNEHITAAKIVKQDLENIFPDLRIEIVPEIYKDNLIYSNEMSKHILIIQPEVR